MSKTINHDIYKESFRLFLKKTNEKKVVLSYIKKEVPLNKEINFLDVGGGDGSFAIPLSKKVKSTLVVEPNIHFTSKLSSLGINCFNGKWEDYIVNGVYDFILAAYVVTHFPKKKFRSLIQKMVNCLSDKGILVIFAIDEKAGTWRGIHTYFYDLINLKRKSSTLQLKEVAEEYNAKRVKIVTEVIADDYDEMLKILAFDFEKYGDKFHNNKEKIIDYLKKRKRHGKIVLKMVHWMYIIRKK